MEPVPTPHDRFFRESFGRPEIARDFLRHYLPPEVLGQVDLDTLSVSKDTYVSKELRAAYSDLVCSAGYRGGELRVYLLFEHKSRPEFRTVLQLLRYVVAEGERYFKERPKARRLPPVYSLVLYHGRKKWREPSTFHDLVEPLTPELAPYVPQFRYALHDVSERSDEEVRGAVLTRLTLLAMRHVFSEEPVARLRELLELVKQVAERRTALEVLETLLRYYVQGTGRVSEEEARTLLGAVSQGEDIMQTFIDKYIEEGHREGHRQGHREGRTLVLLRQIELKFGPPDEATRRRIEKADAEDLLRWSERILFADDLEGVFH